MGHVGGGTPRRSLMRQANRVAPHLTLWPSLGDRVTREFMTTREKGQEWSPNRRGHMGVGWTRSSRVGKLDRAIASPKPFCSLSRP